MDKLRQLTIAEMRQGLINKEFSTTQLIQAHLDAIDHDELNAFITVTHEYAVNKAKEIDKLIHSNEKLPPLAGIPVGVKDLFCTNGIKTTACSRILQNFIPPYESTVSELLHNSGAIMVGKLNMDEFAMGSANINSYFGPVKNPWRRSSDNAELVPGGSSGGSSAAVAGFLCAGALGSDTGGSVRQPAAFCGIVGIKPTYGRCSRWGMISFASSLDQAGVLARTVEDSALMLQEICGHDTKDSSSAKISDCNFTKNLNSSIKGKRIGIPREYVIDTIPDDISNLWNEGIKLLEQNGAIIVDISLPHTVYALPVYYIISSAEASSNLSRYDGVRFGERVEAEDIESMYELTRGLNLGSEVKRRILIGAYALSSGYYNDYYNKAQCVRTLVKQDFIKSFEEKVDYILAPTAPSEAFAFNEKYDPLLMYLNDIFTVPVSLAGLPAISIPAGLSKSGLPLSLQIIGNYYDESGILNVANIIEKNVGVIINKLKEKKFS